MANTFEVFLENGLFKAVINRNFAQQMIRQPWTSASTAVF